MKEKIIIWGIGKNFELSYHALKQRYEIVALTDSNNTLWNTVINDCNVVSPSDIAHYEYSYIIVTPQGKGRNDIIRTLYELNVPPQKIKSLPNTVLSPFLIDPLFFSNLDTEDKKKLLFKNNVELVYIELNSKCNRQCWYCPNSFIDRHSQNISMPQELVNKISTELASIDYSGDITFSYFNEPLIDDNLFSNIEIIRSKAPKAYIHFATNGDYLTHDILVRLEKLGINRIIISNYILNHKGDIYTYAKAESQIVAKAESLGVKQKYYTTPNDISCLACGYFGNMNVIMNCYNFNEWGYNRAGTLKGIMKETGVRQQVCESPYHSCTIAYSGDVVYCGQIHCDFEEHRKYIVGNANKETIFDIFGGEKMNEIRKKTLCDVNSSPCTGCSADTISSLLIPPNGPFRLRPRDAAVYSDEFVVDCFER